MNETQVLAALGVTLLELYQLQRNIQFPVAVSGVWNSGQIAAFGALMTAALSRWTSLTPSNYASANWSTLATTTPGSYTPSPGGLMGGADRVGVYGSGGPRTGIYGKGGLFD